jgi:hypothetical protein
MSVYYRQQAGPYKGGAFLFLCFPGFREEPFFACRSRLHQIVFTVLLGNPAQLIEPNEININQS